MLRAARIGRRGVIGAPVAKAAVVGSALTPGPSPVAKAASTAMATSSLMLRTPVRRSLTAVRTMG